MPSNTIFSVNKKTTHKLRFIHSESHQFCSTIRPDLGQNPQRKEKRQQASKSTNMTRSVLAEITAQIRAILHRKFISHFLPPAQTRRGLSRLHKCTKRYPPRAQVRRGNKRAQASPQAIFFRIQAIGWLNELVRHVLAVQMSGEGGGLDWCGRMLD